MDLSGAALPAVSTRGTRQPGEKPELRVAGGGLMLPWSQNKVHKQNKNGKHNFTHMMMDYSRI